MTFPGTPNANQYTYWDGTKFLPEGVPFHVIRGDDPSVPFLSRRDVAPDVQAWYNSVNTTGGKLRLINPCFKSHIDFTAQIFNQVPISIDMQGEVSMLLNAGELELYSKMHIHGDGGSGFSDIGDAAVIVGYNNTGAKAEDTRLEGFNGRLDGYYYIISFLDNSLTANFPDSANGQILTITSGGDGSAVGTYVVLSQGGQIASYGTHSCFALFQGAGVPNPNQTGLHWTFGASSGTTGQIPASGAGGVFKTIRLSGLTANTIAQLDRGTAYKKHVYLTNCNQTALNQIYRVFGAENITTGSTVAYMAHYPSYDNTGYTTPATFPEFGVGGSSGTPTIEYLFTTSAIRMEGLDMKVSNFSTQNFPGNGIQVDQFRNITSRVHIDRVSMQTNAYSNFFHTIPLELQGFELYITNSLFTYVKAPSVLITNYTLQAETGLIFFDKCLFTGGGIITQPQSIPTETFPIHIINSTTESLLVPFVQHDPRAGLLDEIALRNVSLADQATNIPAIDMLVASTSNFASNILIIRLFGDIATSPPIGTNVRPSAFENKSSFTQGFALPKTKSATAEYTLEDGNRLDSLLTNAPSSFSPVLDFGFNLSIPDVSIWNTLPGTGFGTATVAFTNGLAAPNRLVNNTSNFPDGYIVPTLSGTGQRQLLAYSVTPQVGDYFVVGAWLQSTDPTKLADLGFFGNNWSDTNVRFSNGGTGGTLSDLNGTYVGGHWKYISAIYKVVHSDVAPTQLLLLVGSNNGGGLSSVNVYNYWAKYIPTSASISEQEIVRWYRHHGRYQVPGAGAGNLAIDKRLLLDWGGRLTLGANASNQLITSSSSMLFNGVSGLLDTMITSSNADVTVATTAANQIIGMKALSANRNINLPASPLLGQKIVIKDLDGSLASFNIIVNGNGHNIDGSATLTLTNSSAGPKSAVNLYFVSNTDGWIVT